MKRLALFLVIAVLMASSTTVAAFDNQLKGFIIGGGIGGSWTSFTQELTGFGSSDRENKFGLSTDFKIGGGFNDQFLLYYVNRGAWFTIENVFGDNVWIFNSVGLIGASYYLSPASNTYVLALVGLAAWSAPFEDSNSQIGFGLGGGVGYEFAEHWSVETTLNWGKPEDSEFGLTLSTNAFSLMVMIVGLAY